MAKIIIEHEKCIGCGSCAAICPKYFEMAEDGKSKLKGGALSQAGNYELETEKLECAESAAEACPVQCIQITK
jgi:ferredoxin